MGSDMSPWVIPMSVLVRIRRVGLRHVSMRWCVPDKLKHGRIVNDMFGLVQTCWGEDGG